MKKKIIIPIIIAVCVVILAGVAIYARPVHVAKQLKVYDDSGKEVVLDLDLTWHRSIFSRTTLTGSIKCNGKEYKECFSNMNEKVELNEAAKGSNRIFFFAIDPNTILTSGENYIMICNSNRKFTTLGLVINEDGVDTRYQTR